MAPHSSTLAWKIPWTEEPGRLQSMRSLIVRHDWATSLSLFTFMHWRRKWKPVPFELETHSSTLAWRIPGKGEPGGLPSMGLRLMHSLRSFWWKSFGTWCGQCNQELCDGEGCDQLEATSRKGHTRFCLPRLQNLIPWHGCMNGALCQAAKDLNSYPRVCPSQMCDHGKAHSFSGLRCIVCEKRGQVFTVCEILPTSIPLAFKLC